MLKKNLPGEARQPHYYAWRRQRESRGWKFVGMLLPPKAAMALREFYKKYRNENQKEFEIKKNGKKQ